MGGGEGVHADQRDDVAEGREEVPIRGDVGADVGERPDAEREEAPLAVQGELGLAHVVPCVLVRGDRLAALAHPLHGAAELPRRPEHEPMLGVLPALRPEGAPDVARDDADPVLGDLEDVGRQRAADAVRVLDVGVERVPVLAGVVHPERAPRLHVLGVHAGDHVAAADDPRGPIEGGVGRRLVAGREDIGDVVGALVPHRGTAGQDRRRGGGHRGQRLVVDPHALGRVLGLGPRRGDHEGHGVAHVPRAVPDETVVRWCPHRRAVGPRALERHPHRAEALPREVSARDDREHAGRPSRRGGVDAQDPRVRMRRAHEHGVRLAIDLRADDEVDDDPPRDVPIRVVRFPVS